jgi:hypothetical protein
LNNDAYIIYEPTKKSGIQEIKPFVLPNTTASNNTTDVVIKTELSADMKNLLVIRTTSYQGLQKARAIGDALKFTPYQIDDYKHYGGSSPTANMKPKEMENYDNSVKALKDEFKNQKPEFVKKSLESEFDQKIRNVHFDIISDGRSQKNNTLTIK